MGANVSGIWVRRSAVAAVLVVAGVAAVVSYCHMQHLAELSGEEWRSRLIPLSVDGMLVAATLAIVDRRRVGRPAGWVPWTGLSLGVLASLAANIAAARSDPISRAIAAWPPVALALSVETLVIVLREPVADVALSNTKRHDVGKESDTAPAAPAPSRPKRTSVAAPSDRTVSETRAATLLNSGAGRRKLARALDISEHQARVLLEKHAAEKAPNNGHAVLQEAK